MPLRVAGDTRSGHQGVEVWCSSEGSGEDQFESPQELPQAKGHSSEQCPTIHPSFPSVPLELVLSLCLLSSGNCPESITWVRTGHF